MADLYVKYSDSISENAYVTAINKYKEILDQKKYSIYLFESWLKWGIVTQRNFYGMSKSSEIPNNLYDKMRDDVALVILNHIINNSKDQMAINEFLLMATHPMIKRFGSYRFGNQNAVEWQDTFD